MRTKKDSGPLGRMPEIWVHPIQYITDILLQTQGGTIRLFPALPKEKSASFTNFRARGGFCVSAQTDGQLVQASILSTLGGTCCVKLDDRRLCQAPAGTRLEKGHLYFETQPGEAYELTMEYLA